MIFSLKKVYKFTVLITLICSFFVAAEPQNIQGAKVELKCFVELYGGKETIHFATVNRQNVKVFEQQLLGSKVLTSVAKGKQKIYKVNECVPLTEKFNSAHARQIDEETVR